MINPVEQFRAAIEAAGLTPPTDIRDDGELARFSSNGRRGDDSGWYVLHGDGVPAGVFGCWREGFKQNWCSKPKDAMTPAELQAFKVRMAAIHQRREADLAERHAQACKTATTRWNAAGSVTTHHYLVSKGVQAHGVRAEGEGLLIPMRDTSGTLHSLQVIDPEGGKRFQHGGRVKGCYHSIGKPDHVLIVCEGYATGASIHEATGYAVAVAFNAGNLLAVAEALHQKYPKLQLIVAADDDWQTVNNPGMTDATKTARTVGCWLAIPKFGEDRGAKDTDFNDLSQLEGDQAVRDCIQAAKPLTTEISSVLRGTSVPVWPEPTPLPDALPPVAGFVSELLPVAMRGWVADIAHRMQCPPDFPAVGALVAISSLIGARVVVAPKERDDWRVVPNLWGLIVGRPGVKKSPALSEALKPLHVLESNEREKWQAAHDAWDLDCKVAELATKNKEKEAGNVAAKDPKRARELLTPVATPAEPLARRYVVNDTTVEKLGELLEQNPWGIMSYRDEIHGMLCNMDKQGQEGARAFYLQAYDGNQGYTVDRIGRGTHHIPRVCLAMLGGIQPGKIQSYVREAVAGGAGDDGLLQRFGLVVWPDINREWERADQWPDSSAKQEAWDVFERLNQLQPATDDDPQEWRFSPEAQALYWEWADPFELEIRGEELHPALISHLSKYRKLVPALALIFALVDTPDSNNLIHACELRRALAWCDYLRTHAERIYAAAVIPETAGAKQLLDKIKAGKLCDGDGVLLDAFTPRLVATKHWTGLGKPDEVRKASDLLVDYGWLVREILPTGPTGGRPSERYLINPVLMKCASS